MKITSPLAGEVEKARAEASAFSGEGYQLTLNCSFADFDHIAVGIGEKRKWHTWLVLSALHQFAAGFLDLRDGFVELIAHGEAKMRDTAIADRRTLARCAERDDIVRAWGAQKGHPVHLEFQFEPERRAIERHRTLEIVDIDIDVVQSARFDHWPHLPRLPLDTTLCRH